MTRFKSAVAAAAMSSAVPLSMVGSNVAAAEFSDTAISYRYGTQFREPFNNQDIIKNIFALTHASGFAYGQNFVNVDFLLSNNKDPSTPGGSGAQEAYAVYRNTLDLGKITGQPMNWGVMRGVGLTSGFDLNTKNDFGYSSKKRMFVIGPQVSFDVPGFLNIAVLELRESNAPVGHPERYYYKWHPMLTSAWLIPIPGAPRFQFEGFVNYIAAKGKDEFGAATKPETDFDGQIMFDVSGFMGGTKGLFRVGAEYQFWKNKFGNDHNGPAGSGAFARTPMVRVDYHF
jgi:hypothetical protein